MSEFHTDRKHVRSDYLYCQRSAVDRYSDLGNFAPHHYKLGRNLALNLGLHYEIPMPTCEKYGQETNCAPGINKLVLAGDRTVSDPASVVASAGLTGLVRMAKDYGLPFSLVNAKYDNFAPRVGMAWRPFGGNATVASQTFNRQPNNVNALTFANPFPDALASITGVTSTTGYDVNPPTQYLQSWNLTIERDLGGGVALEVGYAGSKGTHLLPVELWVCEIDRHGIRFQLGGRRWIFGSTGRSQLERRARPFRFRYPHAMSMKVTYELPLGRSWLL
jgi:hypothetical protein